MEIILRHSFHAAQVDNRPVLSALTVGMVFRLEGLPDTETRASP